MKEPTTIYAWFHCGKCGSLFEAVPGFSEERVCDQCHRLPSTGLWAPPSVEQAADLSANKVVEVEPEQGGHSKREVGGKRPKSMILRLAFLWLFMMVMVVWVRQHYTRLDQDKEDQKEVQRALEEGLRADQRMVLLNEALPECHRSLSGFLRGETAAIRNSFVFGGLSNVGAMADFYSVNPLEKVQVENLRRVAQEPLIVGDEPMILTRWKEEGGAEFDAVFRKDGEEWKLDWEHLVRYGAYPWERFLEGEGPAEGEFRLLARRLPDADGNFPAEGRVLVRLMAPLFGKPLETGDAFSHFEMAPRSDEALLLGAAFSAQKEGRKLFGSEEDWMEQEDLVRVRVRIKREAIGEDFKFELVELLACHWISSSERGYDLDKLREDIFGR